MAQIHFASIAFYACASVPTIGASNFLGVTIVGPLGRPNLLLFALSHDRESIAVNSVEFSDPISSRIRWGRGVKDVVML